MFKRNKKAAADRQFGLPLTLRAEDGKIQRIFDAELVSSFRHMATDLAFSGDLPRRIALLSALRGEGVTYTALAFATTLASDTNRKICVIDMNWWSPGWATVLNPAAQQEVPKSAKKKELVIEPLPELVDRPGIAQVIEGSTTLDDVLMPTELPNLSLLPAGTLPEIERPVLARSEALRTLLQELDGRFDHLILDVPAVLATSDAIALASLADACCVVVRHGVTPTSSVQHALDDVRNLPMLGVVFNRTMIHTPGWIRSLIPQG